ncbi:MAG: threonine/serine exporter family protein, partial [Peptostreptococcaceae bacterium]|nr:threonine/serine exporter family protein [Peptostreptococcaceae bacterium]
SKPNMLIVGSIMPLLPGVALIKGLRDLISGDLISGVARAFDALLTAMAIAFGVGFILEIWLRLGGVL